MANDNNIKEFTALNIEKYHKGLLSPKEMHDMEKAALDDPFLADALEGYATEGVQITTDIAELKERLTQKTERSKTTPLYGGNSNPFPWLRAAAMVVLLIGAAIMTYFFVFDNKNEEIAKIEKPKTEQIKTSDSDAFPNINPDSASNTVTNAAGKQEDDTKNLTGNISSTPGSSSTNIPQKDIAATSDKISGEVTSVSAVKEEADDKKIANAEEGRQKQEEAAGKELKVISANAPPKTTYYKDGAVNQGFQYDAEYKNKTYAANRKAKAQDQYRNYNIFRGRVTDASNFGVPFANVTNVEDNVGTYSDARGYFNLTSPDSVLNVQVRSIGFENNIIQLRNNVPNNQVVLNDDKSLSALVISNSRLNAGVRSQNMNVKLEEPEPADGWENYDTYLVNNLNIPEEVKSKQNSDATVQVSFEVDKNGEPVNIRVEKSLCDKCDKEAIRLVKEGPKWKRNARKGRTTVTIPFNQLFR